MQGSSVRVLVVDDSSFFRGVMRRAIGAIEGVEVIGEAVDGEDALRAIEALSPDLVILDVEMPKLDGLGVLKALRERGSDTRVIMVSSLTRAGAPATVNALCLGASDYVQKPSAGSSEEARAFLERELGVKIAALAPRPLLHSPAVVRKNSTASKPAVLGIAVSTGGPAALHSLFGSLPAGFSLPIAIVQHMPAGFTAPLAESLSAVGPLDVIEARTGMLLEPGTALIAPGDRHLEIIGSSGRSMARVTDSEPEEACRPSANILFRSMVGQYGASTLALVMTGVGSDGLAGCHEVVRAGGTVLAQDEHSSLVFGMPKCVIDEGLASRIQPLDRLGATLVELSKDSHAAA